MNIFEQSKVLLEVIPILKKNFKEFIIMCLITALMSLHYLNIDLNKSMHRLSKEAADRQYSLDTVEINYLKRQVAKKDGQIEDANNYNKKLSEMIENNTIQLNKTRKK